MATEKIRFLCLIALVLVIGSDGAPKKSKRGGEQTPQTVYDQKQTGDYNIQLHLKDFQIIAVLGDDTANFGDYDYSYDYSDFTIKPATHKPTESPISSSPLPPIPSTTYKPTTASSSTKPPYQPYPFIHPSSEKPAKDPPKPEEKPSTSSKPLVHDKPFVSEKPLVQEKPFINENVPLIVAKPLINEKPLINDKPLEPQIEISVNSSAVALNTTQKNSKLDDFSAPGRIKVQIIETPTPVQIGVVPGEDLADQNETLPQGEILHFKRYGFSRLASNLASRFRQTSEESSASSSESKED
ncbi:unnamed protein product [Psylliodes chrysocephalus]|uniref:Uncharacterized protein n=1 Tax=Psylliodes chrysocephalus TaxID=3402493 RepID=A0A9P0CHV8_9CUCU|nr:unnamed protein product [Psylliodes chrysocephala]